MSLENTPKVDFTTSDGVTDDNLNDIGKNLVALEDSKYESGDSPNFAVVTLSDTMKWKRYSKGATTQGEIFTALNSWVPNTDDYMSCEGQIDTAEGKGSISLIKRISGTLIHIIFVEHPAGLETTFGNSGSAVTVTTFEIMSNFDAF